MSEISPFVLACWRLQITTILLIPAGIHDLLKMTSEERWKMVGQFHLVSAAGLLLVLTLGPGWCA